MVDLNIVGEIIKRRAENQSDENIKRDLMAVSSEKDINDAISAIESDLILTIKTIPMFTPITPVVYRLGIRKIEKEIRVLHGFFKDTLEIGIRTIDKINILKTIMQSKITIMHSSQSQVVMEHISKSDAEKIRKFYSDVIESQRKSIVNVAED